MPVASNDDTWIQIIKERCFLLKASSSEQRRRATETRGRWRGRFSLRATGINCFTPGVGRGTITVVSGAHIEQLPPPKYKHYTRLTSSIPSRGPFFADAFCMGYWNTYFFEYLVFFFIVSWAVFFWLLWPTTAERVRGRHQYFYGLEIFNRIAPTSTLNSHQQNYRICSSSTTYFILFFFLLQIHLKKQNFRVKDGLF